MIVDKIEKFIDRNILPFVCGVVVGVIIVLLRIAE